MKLSTLLVMVFLLGQVPSLSLAQNGPKILVLGDSMMAWNRFSRRSIPDYLQRALKQPVKAKAMHGAKFNGKIESKTGIPAQYENGDWDWVIINGGANDLIFRCGCNAKSCAPIMEGMVSKDGSHGSIPRLVTKARKDGAKVLFVGYHRARQMNAPARKCGDDLDALDVRLARMAKRTKGVYFANMQNVFPAGDTTYYAADKTHPSPKGSATMAAALLPWFKK